MFEPGAVEKRQVRDFWNEAACGEDLYLRSHDRAGFLAHAKRRYELEPYILDFARFDSWRGKKVLEIGVGLGADHQRFAQAGADLYGLDLTERAVSSTRQRLELFDLTSCLQVGDAENLEFGEGVFDLVYSWGVLHHSPDTKRAVDEVWRVLKFGGAARIMIYNKYSLVGLMLWVRYGLLRFRPFTRLSTIYASYLESPGTKAYSRKEAQQLVARFSNVNIQTVLTHGDLLESNAGQRHQGAYLDLARRIWPRWLIRHFFPRAGLFMLIEAEKLQPNSVQPGSC